MRIIALVLLLLPLAEIAGFVVVGSRIGALATIGLVLASGLLGVVLMRVQGFGAVSRIRAELDAGRTPGRELANTVMIFAAGILLLIPGFITDIAGLLLFIPAVRRAAFDFLSRRIVVRRVDPMGGTRRYSEGQGRTIDLDPDEFEVEPETDAAGPRLNERQTPWRKPPDA